MRELYVQTENCLFAKEQSFVHKGGTMYGGTITSGQLNIFDMVQIQFTNNYFNA